MFDFFLMFAFILGTLFGSFVNCLAWRMYHGESMMTRSHCPRCQRTIEWFDNIPLISWVILKARCRHCHEAIAKQYLLVELALGLLFAWAFYYHLAGLDTFVFFDQVSSFNIHTLSLLRDWLVIVFLAAIFIMDYQWYVVADEISLPAIITVLAANLALGLAFPLATDGLSWQKLILAGAVGAGFFVAQYFLSGGRWVGGGDIRIGALMGVALGWPNVLTALALAYGLGAVGAIYLVVIKKKQQFSFRHLWQPEPTEATIMPFGPFLAIGTLIAMFYGGGIIDWYLHLMI